MIRCKGCKYRAAPNSGYLCDYAAQVGHLRGGAVEDCTVREPGERCDLPRQSPPITERAARLDKERRRAAALKNVRRSKLDGEGALKLYREGLSDRELALAFGMTRGAVTKWRKKRGLAANGTVGRRKG